MEAPLRRLGRLGAHVRPAPTVLPGPDGAAPRFRAGTANGLGVTVEQDPATGEVHAETALAHVLEQKQAAVEAEDYALAGHLHQLYKVLHPANRLTPDQCKPQTPEEQIAFFHEHGVRTPPTQRGPLGLGLPCCSTLTWPGDGCSS